MPVAPTSAVPSDWKKVDSRKFPGCCYYIKPDGEATWLLPGQKPSELKKDMQSLYRKDYISDPQITQILNPSNARTISSRHTSYGVHPKAPASRDHETYQSLNRQDFKKFPSHRPQARNRDPFRSPRFVANSTYRDDFIGAEGTTIDDEVRQQEGLILSGVKPQPNGGTATGVSADSAVHCSPYQRKQIAVNVSKHLQEGQGNAAASASVSGAVGRRRSGGIFPCHWGDDDGVEERKVFRPSFKPARPQTAGPRATGGEELPMQPLHPYGSVKRPFQSRPVDRNHSYRNTPFVATTDYQANFVDYKPKRPHLYRPDNQIEFGETWVCGEDKVSTASTTALGGTHAGGHPNSLYRVSFGGRQPPFGKTNKSVIHAQMLNLPSHYQSRSKAEYCPDEEQSPSANFRSRLRGIDHRVVQRLKTSKEIGDGTTA